MKRQISAIKDLVTVTNQQLEANKIDTDVRHEDIPVKYHRFEAFFFAPNIGVLICLVSAGSPTAQENHGLFLDIYHNNKEENEIKKLVEIHTAKLPEFVDEQGALKLSNYKPKQLLQIAEFVKSAIPIESKEFYSFFKGPLPVKDRS